MVAPSSGTSQVECEPYRHQPHPPTFHRVPSSSTPSTPYDSSEPRSISHQPSLSASSSSRLTQTITSTISSPPGTTATNQSQTTPSQSNSAGGPRAATQVSQDPSTPTAHVRHSSSSVSSSAPGTATSSPIRHRRSASLQNTASMAQPPVVQLKNLDHLKELANASNNNDGSSRSFSRRQAKFEETRFDVCMMPVADIIELVAALLTKITTTNDRNHENLHRNMPSTDGSGNLPEQATSVLAFHGKNVPTITIHSYLSRIHRYCPTTYEVFLSLLVYFDRMTERVNAGPNHLAPNVRPATPGSATVSPHDNNGEPGHGLGNFFVVDSYNIHRLVIAGVTCASKFFSDIFYTNSRYAKVGGLPLVELNHLELQFLTLNDFRLSIPVEELESYGNMLVQFYAREELSGNTTGSDSNSSQSNPVTE